MLILTLLFVGITGTILYMHRGEAQGIANIARWLVAVLVIATLSALFFGVVPLLLPTQFGSVFGFTAKDVFIFRQAGATTLGYGVMGILELRSRNWSEVRWPAVMAAVFNGLAFVVTVIALAIGDRSLLAYLALPVSLGVTLAIVVALRCGGK